MSVSVQADTQELTVTTRAVTDCSMDWLLTASSNCCRLRNMVTVKISADARKLLRVLAAHKGKSMYDVAEDLFWAECKRLKLSMKGTTAQRNGSSKTRDGK